MAKRKKKSKILTQNDVSYLIDEASFLIFGRTQFASIASRLAINYLLPRASIQQRKQLRTKEQRQQKVIRLPGGIEYYPPSKSGVTK